jgi:hypothetical protein
MSLFKKSDVSGLPKAFGGSAFIAFHGSWNRAPYPQEGYNVVVQPFKDGRPSGTFVVFADGFAGAVKQPGKAAHRPSGLAVGPDGAVYITDDVHGRIWRVTFQGDTTATVIEPAPPPTVSRADAASSDELPPEGIHPDAGEQVATLPTPPGATSEEWHLGVGAPRRREGGAMS